MTDSPKSITIAAAFLSAILAGVASPAGAESREALIKRGTQLVGIGGCMDCHTPFKMGPKGPEKDLSRGLSGHPQELKLAAPPRLDAQWNWVGASTMTAFAGPWGRSYAANLTPDRETGMGAWREKDFVQAMRTGKHLGVGRPIAPPMPWQALTGLPDKDLRAIYAYLMAQPAISNKVPDYQPPIATARAGE